MIIHRSLIFFVREMSKDIANILSLTASSFAPNCVETSHFLAKKPSNKSVRQAIIVKMRTICTFPIRPKMRMMGAITRRNPVNKIPPCHKFLFKKYTIVY